MGSTLDVTGATTLGSTLAVTGASTLTGATSLGSTLGVTGATTLSSTLGVTGATTLAGDLTVQTDKLAVSSTAVKIGTNLVAGLQQLSASGGALSVSTGSTLVIISQAGATADFTVSLPSAPQDGQLLFVRNDSNFVATCDTVALAAQSGSLFAGLGGAWVVMI